MKKTIFSALALFALASCSETDESPNLTPSELRIISSIATRTSGNMWESNDQIGVYMSTNGGTFGDLGANALYTTTSGDGKFTSNDPLYFPTSGTVDLLAYYPYSADSSFDVEAYPVDVTNQSDQGALDLMSVSITDQAETSDAVEMTFDHKLSRIQVTLKAGDGVESTSLTGGILTLSGTDAEATFDLTSDGITLAGNVADITLSATATSNIYEGIIIPQTLSGATLVFTTTSGSIFTATLTTSTFEVGKEYTYNVTIGRTSVTLSSENINTWGDGSETDDDIVAGLIYDPLTVDYSSIAEVNALLSSSDIALRLSNCYMVDPVEDGTHIIIPVGSRINTYWGDAEYGDDNTLLIDTDWTTNETYTVEPLWNDFSLDSYTDQITFSKVAGVDEPYAMQIDFAEGFSYKGNMVVAVKKSDTIVWSWHIWITDYNPYTKSNGTTYEIDFYGFTLTWMDRNIGARDTAYHSDSEGSIFYQWGRKDPITSTATAVDGDVTRTIADVVKAPEYFYCCHRDYDSETNTYTYASDYDWCGGDTDWDQDRDHHWRDAKLASVNDKEYGTTKSIYDPSPLGFMVPCSNNTDVYSSPFSFMGNGGVYADGYSWSSNGVEGSNGIFFPASGYRGYSSAGLYYVGSGGHYWSASPSSSTFGYNLYFGSTGVYTAYTYYRANGFPVRPVQE